VRCGVLMTPRATSRSARLVETSPFQSAMADLLRAGGAVLDGPYPED
jgi:hypothetical protein